MKFVPFDIQYSLFDLPARPLIGFAIAPQMLINATVVIARPSICMAGGYSAVLFCKFLNLYPPSLWRALALTPPLALGLGRFLQPTREKGMTSHE
jgi:hypothetical protein